MGMNIYQKIAEVMKNVQYLAKDDAVSFGNTKYKAMSEEKVTAVMREQMLKVGLVVFPTDMVTSRDGNITHVDVTYKMVNIDNPDESILIASCGDGADTQDKGSGKAMTYAFKYMWLRTFAIPTGEDPDKICNEEIEYKQKKEAEAKTISDRNTKTATDIITKAEADNLKNLCDKAGVNHEKLLAQNNVKAYSELNAAQYVAIINLLGKDKK